MGYFNLPAIKDAFSSKEAFVDAIRVEEAPNDRPTVGKGRWSNRDLEPTPPEERNWEWYSLATFWFTTAFGTTGWNAAASLIATGMTWQQTFIASVLGCLICAVTVTLMARGGVQYHVGFPVLCRSVMGMWGAYFFIFLRGVVCIIWYGIQTYYAANLLSVCFRCMFGSSWDNWENTLPASAAVTSKQILCFFIVWLIQVPLVLVHPKKIHWLFAVKGVILPISTFALFGWCMAKGGGTKSLDLANKPGSATASNVSLGWAVMNGINVILGTLSPMFVNQPDLSRYCKKTADAGWIQSIALFCSKLVVLFLGLASTTSMQAVWGKAYWSLWDLLEAILDHYWSAGSRTAIWFLSLTYILSCVAANLGSNSLPFGADFSSLVPRYITIVRGQVICAVLGIVIQPWQLLQNAAKFVSFLGSYNIFMAPLCAVFIVDYTARNGNIHVPSLYDGKKGSLYWFWGGVNWKGVFAWTGGMIMGIPGLIGQYEPDIISQAAKNMYLMGWVLTFFTAAILYAVASLIMKPKIYPAALEDMPKTWEYLAVDGREGFFEGEREGEGVVISGVSSDVETAMVMDSKNEKFAEK